MVIRYIEKKYKPLIENINNYFTKSTSSIHKARNEIKIIEYEGNEYIVKSFKQPNIINRFIYSVFRDSKAKRSYENSIKISKFVPKPVGYVEHNQIGFITSSYFVSERFHYDFTIREPLLDNNFDDKESILKAFAKFSYQLHENKIFHKDYSPGNILIKKEDTEYIFKIVDINRMDFFDMHLEDRAKSFSKLWASDEELVIIAKEYMKYYQCEERFIRQICYYSNKNKNIKNFKKRLKGKKVVD